MELSGKKTLKKLVLLDISVRGGGGGGVATGEEEETIFLGLPLPLAALLPPPELSLGFSSRALLAITEQCDKCDQFTEESLLYTAGASEIERSAIAISK